MRLFNGLGFIKKFGTSSKECVMIMIISFPLMITFRAISVKFLLILQEIFAHIFLEFDFFVIMLGPIIIPIFYFIEILINIFIFF